MLNTASQAGRIQSGRQDLHAEAVPLRGEAASQQHDPTGQLYPELQQAYAYFNARLFDARLPPVLITLQRRHHTEGYWSPNRFANRNGGYAGELAMNPCYFAIRSLEAVLATLVHAQVHVWQTYFGAPGRRGYHNREWADKMISLGLQPSATGRPGGGQTGENVGHYVVAGGPFERAASQLVASDDFALTWYDRVPALLDAADAGEQSAASIEDALTADTPDRAPRPAALHPADPSACAPAQPDAQSPPGRGKAAQQQPPAQLYPALALQLLGNETARPARTRHKFSCPACSASAWGKPGLQLKCVPCDAPLRRCDHSSAGTEGTATPAREQRPHEEPRP